MYDVSKGDWKQYAVSDNWLNSSWCGNHNHLNPRPLFLQFFDEHKKYSMLLNSPEQDSDHSLIWYASYTHSRELAARNLISTDNETYTLMLLCWNADKEVSSPPKKAVGLF